MNEYVVQGTVTHTFEMIVEAESEQAIYDMKLDVRAMDYVETQDPTISSISAYTEDDE